MADEKGLKKTITEAGHELEAAVKGTEDAVHKILAAAEEIQKLAASAPADLKSKIIAKVTDVFNACTFQDITGQRIRKVGGILKDIEKVAAGIKLDSGAHSSKPQTERDKEKHLLNGPQLKQPGQDEIDKMFKGDKKS